MIRIPIEVSNKRRVNPIIVKVRISKLVESGSSLMKFNSVFPERIIPRGNQDKAAIIEIIADLKTILELCSILIARMDKDMSPAGTSIFPIGMCLNILFSKYSAPVRNEDIENKNMIPKTIEEVTDLLITKPSLLN